MTRGLTGMALAILSVVGLVVIAMAWFFLLLPDVRILRGCLTTNMFHVHLCEKDSSFTPIDQISPYILGAVIMSEDASFYSHGGVDVEEMKESAIKDMNEGKFARGGSTITQQLAKNVFLSGSKNILRKLEEIYLAFQIEKYFSKTKILTLYLNVVQFAPDVYGVKAACQHYFKRPPNEVTPEQAAFLAFLLPNPEKYSQSFTRRQLTPFADKMVRTILHKMFLGHKINESEYQESDARVAHFAWDEDIPKGLPDISSPPDEGNQGERAGRPEQAGMEDSPMGVVPGSSPGMDDESNQTDDDFKFDFSPDEKNK